jgi:hypothetical protein
MSCFEEFLTDHLMTNPLLFTPTIEVIRPSKYNETSEGFRGGHESVPPLFNTHSTSIIKSGEWRVNKGVPLLIDTTDTLPSLYP